MSNCLSVWLNRTTALDWWNSSILGTETVPNLAFKLKKNYSVYFLYILIAFNYSHWIFVTVSLTSFYPSFWWGPCYSIFGFMCMFCGSFFVLFSFGHCIVCPSIYGFWLPLWYLQTLFKIKQYSFYLLYNWFYNVMYIYFIWEFL